MMKNVNYQSKHYTWVPARVTDDIQEQIDSVARAMGVEKHQVVSAALKAGLSLAQYQLGLDQVFTDRGTRLN